MPELKTTSRISPQFSEVKAKMKKDNVYEKIWKSVSIIEFGEVLMGKLGSKRKNDIAQRMRRVLLMDKTSEIDVYIYLGKALIV